VCTLTIYIQQTDSHSKDPTNSIKLLNEKNARKVRKTQKSNQNKIQQNNKHTHIHIQKNT